jgi:hypothetical protein
VMRPTNGLFVIAATVLVAVKHRRELPRYLLAAAAVALPFCAYNLHVYGALFAPYYQAARIIPASAALFVEALAGNLVSPARGLLVFSPVFLFATWGAVLHWRERRNRAEVIAWSGVIVLHWLAVSGFPHWWGGYSYGPRFMTDLTPSLCWFLAPVIAQLPGELRSGAWKRPVAVGFSLTLVWSAFAHGRGATSRAAEAWNAYPADVDTNPHRLWDYGDLPFLRTELPPKPKRTDPAP